MRASEDVVTTTKRLPADRRRQQLLDVALTLFAERGYNATTMERSKKGWYTALIPGTRVTGKLLHYYVEARDGRQAVAASNGRAASPNIAMIRPARAN